MIYPPDRTSSSNALHHISDLGERVGLFSVCPIPTQEIAGIGAVLTEVQGGQLDVTALAASPESSVRTALAKVAPTIGAMAAELGAVLESSHSAALVPSLGLERCTLDEKHLVLYALALGLGSPTATDKLEQRVIWDVKARPWMLEAGTTSTFSEHASHADLHTDTQYYPEPERYMLLYFLRGARCGGGATRLRDATSIHKHLTASEEGRWALAELSRSPLPFRIPGTFTTTGRLDTVEATLAPVFSSRPRLRFRSDTLQAGLEAFPHYDTPGLRRALATLQAEIDHAERWVEHTLASDGAVFVNNHECVHGRTAFSDLERHALRIRIADGQPQQACQALSRAAGEPADALAREAAVLGS